MEQLCLGNDSIVDNRTIIIENLQNHLIFKINPAAIHLFEAYGACGNPYSTEYTDLDLAVKV